MTISRPATLCASIAIAILSPSAAAQNSPYATGKSHWLAARYGPAMPPLRTHRRGPEGRTAEVDYMLGTSACRTPAERRWGARVLNFALYSYPLTSASRLTLERERDRCRGSAALPVLTAMQTSGVDTAVVAGATARGKLFNFGDRGIAAYPARRVRELTRAEIDRRLVPVGEAGRMTAMLRALSPAPARVRVTGRYAFVTSAGQSDAELNRVAAQLDRYLAFLGREYGMAAPGRYLTIYLTPDIAGVRRVADLVHGLDVSPSTLGYSFQDDLSLAAMVRGAQSGTIMHELFHLLARVSFGDIPQWLDEGMASLYEVSAEREGRWVGLPNWRGRVLDQAWDLRPPLTEVITSPWFAFDRTESDRGGAWMMSAERAAVHLATARYLVLYLQEQGVLAATFRAFRDRDPGGADDPERAAVRLIETQTAPIASVQTAYDAWLRGAVRRDETNAPDTPGRTLPDSNAPPTAS